MSNIARVSINDIKQTEISDKGKNSLCIALCSMQMAAVEIGMIPTLEDIDRWVDECNRVGALRSKDKKESDGWVLSHEKIAEVVGLKNVVKVYKKFNANEIAQILRKGKIVELRDEGKHSLLAIGWYRDDDTELYAECQDPWPKTNDTRLDLKRAMTQRFVGGKYVDSRSIEYYGIYQGARK